MKRGRSGEKGGGESMKVFKLSDNVDFSSCFISYWTNIKIINMREYVQAELMISRINSDFDQSFFSRFFFNIQHNMKMKPIVKFKKAVAKGANTVWFQIHWF